MVANERDRFGKSEIAGSATEGKEKRKRKKKKALTLSRKSRPSLAYPSPLLSNSMCS